MQEQDVGVAIELFDDIAPVAIDMHVFSSCNERCCAGTSHELLARTISYIIHNVRFTLSQIAAAQL